MISDYFTFVRELPRSFPQIGAMLPSSPALGRLMVRPIRNAEHPLNILEVGPGTGPFTRQILKLMRPRDTFVICEINSRFISRLQKSLQKNPYYRRHEDRVLFFEGPVQELPQSEYAHSFDVIVSSLPFMNFSPEMVDEIFGIFQSLAKSGGSLTFVQYVGLSKLVTLFCDKDSRERVRGVEHVIQEWCEKVTETGEVHKRISVLNVPPAFSLEFEFGQNGVSQRPLSQHL